MVVDTTLNPDLNVEKENISESEEDLEHDYATNMSNGKKNLLCSDFPEAVACFQAACSSQSERFGDTSPECAEAFFYYGRALLELARVENGVLGNALKGVPESEDSDSDTEEQFEKVDKLPDDERDRLRQDVEAAMAKEEDEGAQEENNADSENVDEKQDDVKGEVQSEEEAKPESSQKTPELDNDVPSTSSGKRNSEDTNEENIEDPDEISNMQLAWEMLELAKVLYTKKPKTKETSLMIAQCLLKLGELGLEIENYNQAIDDFMNSLSIYRDTLPAHDRRIAETHYNLGLANNFVKQHEQAITHYEAALSVLESRIDFLNKLIDENDQKKEDVMQECAEVGELKSLIPDINCKIEDVIMMKRQEARLAGSVFAQEDKTSSGFGSTSQTISPVATVIPTQKGGRSAAATSSDISHLVRRKRAPSEEKENASKKMKRCEPTVTNDNGEKQINSSANAEPSTKKISLEAENRPSEIQTVI